MNTKNIDVNGQIFRCRAEWTVDQAESRIRSWCGLQHGVIAEDGVPVLGTEMISPLTGTLAFVGGRSLGTTAASASTDPIQYVVHIHQGRSDAKNLRIKSLKDLQIKVETKWPTLAFMDYSLRYERDDSILYDLTNISHLKKNCANHIVVIPNVKEFSKVTNRNEVLQVLGVSEANVVVDNAKFGEGYLLDEELYDEAVDICADDICRRLTLFRPDSSERISDSVCREFVSPILIHSMMLTLQALKENNYNTSLLLCCDKQLIGRRFHGPVDFSIMYVLLDIVVTEAKKSDVEAGLYQNILQQHVSLELLSDTFTDTRMLGKRRRDELDARYQEFKAVSAGIVTTGKAWKLIKVVKEGTAKKIVHSNEMHLNLDSERVGSDPDFRTSITKELKRIIRKICWLIFDQVEEVVACGGVIEKYSKGFNTVSRLESQLGRADTFNNDFNNTENEDTDDMDDI